MNSGNAGGKPPAPAGEHEVTLKLVKHDAPPGGIVPSSARNTREPRWHTPPDAIPAHRPTPAECYGCVDWFCY